MTNVLNVQFSSSFRIKSLDTGGSFCAVAFDVDCLKKRLIFAQAHLWLTWDRKDQATYLLMYSPVRAQPHVRHLKQLTCHCLSKASRDWPCLISSPQPAQSGGEGRRGERKSRKRCNENAHMHDRNRQEHFEHLCIYHSPSMSLPFCSANLSSLLYLLLLSSSSLSPVVTVTPSLPDGATRLQDYLKQQATFCVCGCVWKYLPAATHLQRRCFYSVQQVDCTTLGVHL